jgi:hypothetical protein
MSIFIIYIGIIGPLFRFDCINFKVSLIIKIINLNEDLKMVPLTMFVIFHVNMITCQNFNLLHIYCIFIKNNSFFETKIFKLITWYPNMVQTMWNDMVQYAFNFHKD